MSVHPNPFKNGFVVEIPFADSREVEFGLFDLRGREIETRISKSTNSFYIEAGKNLQQGIYILEISSENQSVLKKMIKL